MLINSRTRDGRKTTLLTVLVYAVLFTVLSVPWLDLPQAGLIDVIYGCVFAVVAASLTLVALRPLRSVRAPRQRARLVLWPLSIALALVLSVLRWYLPDIGWRHMPAAPAPLVELVSTSHVDYFGGSLFARSVDGRLQVLECREPYECTWTVAESLPDQVRSCDEYRCPGPGSRGSLLVLPPAPGSPIQQLHLTDLEPDGGSDWYYTLTRDGTLWSLGNFTSGFDCVTLPFAVLAGVVGAWILDRALLQSPAASAMKNRSRQAARRA